MCKNLLRKYRAKKHTLYFFKDKIQDKRFSSIEDAKSFVFFNLISDKMGCYMYLMTVLADEFDRSKYIDANNQWITDSNGVFVVHRDFADIVSDIIYNNNR